MKPFHFIVGAVALLLGVLFGTMVFATEAEETTTLTTPLSETITAANTRVTAYSRNIITGKSTVDIQGWNATASTVTPATQIHFAIGETLADGVTVGTLVTGPGLAKATPSGAKWLGNGECSATQADLKQWCKDFATATPPVDDPEARARKELNIQCLGGS